MYIIYNTVYLTLVDKGNLKKLYTDDSTYDHSNKEYALNAIEYVDKKFKGSYNRMTSLMPSHIVFNNNTDMTWFLLHL